MSKCNNENRYCPVLKKVIEVGLCYDMVYTAVIPDVSPSALPNISADEFREAFHYCPKCEHFLDVTTMAEYELAKSLYDKYPPPFK